MFTLTLGSAYEARFLGRGYNFSYAEIIFMIGMIVFIMRALLKSSIFFYSNDKLLFSWIFLTVWMVAIPLWSDDPFEHLGRMISMVECLLIYIIVIDLFHSDLYSFSYYFQIGERLLAISLVVQLTIAMWPLLIYSGSLTFYGIKEYATTAIGKSNHIALYFEFAFIYELIRRAKYFSIFIVITMVGLIITFSRAGLIITFIMIAILFIKEIWKLQFKKLIIPMIMLLCLVVVISVFMTSFVDILKSSIINLQLDTLLFPRIERWKSSLTFFKEAPLLANGLNQKYHSHSTIVRALSSFGIIGSIPYFIIILIPIKKLIYFILLKRSHLFRIDALALLIAYSAIFLHSLVEPFFLAKYPQILFGIIFAYVTILTKQYDIKAG